MKKPLVRKCAKCGLNRKKLLPHDCKYEYDMKKPIKEKNKVVKAWIEICQCKSPGCTPTLWNKKPSKREIKNGEEFNYKYYPCEITYKLPSVRKE